MKPAAPSPDERTTCAAEFSPEAIAAAIERGPDETDSEGGETDVQSMLIAALRGIADGCIARRPGHVDYERNRTRSQIEAIARIAIAKALGRSA